MLNHPREANSPAEFLDFCAEWTAALAIGTALMVAMGSAVLATFVPDPCDETCSAEP